MPASKPRLSLKRRIWRRILIMLPITALVWGLAYTGKLDILADRLSTSQMNWMNDYQLIEHLRHVVVEKGLTHDQKDCLLFVTNGNDPLNAVRMRVMEKHVGKCPGDKNTLPLLFTLKVDKINKTVESDYGSPGEFHPLLP